MKSRTIIGTGIALIAALSIVAGLRAQEPGSGTLTFKTIFTFNNPFGGPSAALVQGTDGNLYGTTAAGGAEYEGTVFRITPQGQLATLYTFAFDGVDGSDPLAPLILGTDGNFYGTTYLGGANHNICQGATCGTVFKVTPDGELTTLYSFCSQAGCADGVGPSGLVQGTNGNFYGTTSLGASTSCTDGCGTVFKITPSGVLTTLYEFTVTGGWSPSSLAGLVEGTDGNFYGTTGEGGTGTGRACYGGCGTVFKITPQGVLTTLHNFTGTGAEGYGPGGTLIQGADGDFYGTTGLGGSSKTCGYYGCGTVFKVTPEGAFATLAGLNEAIASEPRDGLVQARDGNFYGTGDFGGACNCGAVFEVTPEGALIQLHSFNNSSGGYFPSEGLLQATNGGFYGDTFYSTPGYGAVFALSTGLGPFVSSVPTRGKAGIPVKILGNALTGATGVTFNGVAAAFTVESSTYITTTVPEGATTGPIEVTLPSGTLSSNVPFRVLP